MIVCISKILREEYSILVLFEILISQNSIIIKFKKVQNNLILPFFEFIQLKYLYQQIFQFQISFR